ncbi:MAG TPA: hypothetical protein VFZ78_03525 [Flavisolibacter sp.]
MKQAVLSFLLLLLATGGVAQPGIYKDTADCRCDMIHRARDRDTMQLSVRKWHNLIRDNPKMRGPFEKKMIENFFWKCGNYRCTDAEFTAVAMHAARQWNGVTDSLRLVQEGDTLVAKKISFYGVPELDYALGSAWVIAASNRVILGFFDIYDFPKASFTGKGRRPFVAEVATRFVRMFREHTRDFVVYYWKQDAAMPSIMQQCFTAVQPSRSVAQH